ncbi:toxin-antitoxin system HicB family antitoxin [uncultured Fusobacterium sp.]|nr:toxin-antitoxin system HicB family antitoxin [uncultured Fusobacterium sp.]
MKNISFKVEDEFHKQLKIKATEEGKSIKEYVIELIKKDLEKSE